MAIETGDYVIAALAADGERVAIKIKPNIELGDYVIAALAADGELVACGLDPMDTEGQAGIIALAADGERVGLVPITEEADCLSTAITLTIVIDGFAGTSPFGENWADWNGTHVIQVDPDSPNCTGVVLNSVGSGSVLNVTWYDIFSRWDITFGWNHVIAPFLRYSKSADSSHPLGPYAYLSEQNAGTVTSYGTVEVTNVS